MAHTVPLRDTTAGHPVSTGFTGAGRLDPEMHEWAFRVWLQLDLDAQIEGFHAFLRSQSAPLPLWLDSSTYQACLSAPAADVEKRLFYCQMEILLAIHRHRCRRRDAGYARVEQMLDLAHREHGNVQISIKLLTDRLQTSGYYIGVQFLHRTQTSFRHYLRLVRTRRAAELLRGQCLPVHQVSAALGHSDPAHLTREIRAVLGISPGALSQLVDARRPLPPALAQGSELSGRREAPIPVPPLPAPSAAPAS